MREIYLKNPICAIFRNIPTEKILPYAQAVLEGGIKVFEVAANTGDAFLQIEQLKNQFQQDAIIGAGTIITQERCQMAYDAGAEFFLTPSTNINTLKFCIKNKIKLLPGVMTPSDVDICLQYGFNTMKVFPAGSLPRGYIKSLKGPFDDSEYVAVGGVNLSNIEQFMEEGYIGVGIGGELVPKEYILGNEWKKISEHIKENLKRIR